MKLDIHYSIMTNPEVPPERPQKDDTPHQRDWGGLLPKAALAISAVSLALSGVSLARSEQAVEEAWAGKQCATVVAQYDRLSEARTAAERVLAGGLSEEEAGELRAQLSQAEAELVVRSRDVRDCLDEQERDRRESTLRMVRDALEVLHKVSALRPSKLPSPSAT